MNCPEVRDLLPLHLIGDLTASQEAGVSTHLAGCAGCRAEADGLRGVLGLLDRTPAPEVRVNVAAIREEGTRRRERAARRWRRAAVFAVAAGLLLAVGSLMRVTIRAESGQLVLGWGEPKETPKAAEQPDLTRIEERLQVLDELVQLVAADVEDRDLRQQRQVARLRAQLQQLARTSLRADTAEQDLAAVTQALENLLKEKGATP